MKVDFNLDVLMVEIAKRKLQFVVVERKNLTQSTIHLKLVPQFWFRNRNANINRA